MSYRITIEPSGHRFFTEPGESILNAALRHGLVIPYSCRNGTCGTCMGKVVEGAVTYPGGGPPASLDEKEVAVGQALFCLAQPAGDLVIEVREVMEAGDILPRRMRCRVARMERLCRDVMALYLKLPDHERLPFLPGQYIDILLRDGRRRSFSLANAPHDDALLQLHVRHIDGGEFSEHVFYTMQEKALLRIEGPYGTFHIRTGNRRPVLMLAGSTGIAPAKSMLAHMFHTDDPRPVHLFWGARTRADLYMDSELRAWAGSHPRLQYTPCLSEPQPQDDWQGRIGLVHNMLLHDYPDLHGYDVYMSGPPAMIAAARRDFARHGVEDEHLFWDAFEFAADSQPDLTSVQHGDWDD
ncbi:CDP-6-deoxy-delta-3,4-glucoseen reductase [Aquisalimonas sp.]|uniref:CDP-6-deoxy-delta-3,4-glucoseen reductase n=1 Tax=Aquisalimonas sp. TaxID=1872621 RepID=UPI0025C3C780|nr:CDP-6-deoxy-delta-3,4-glucoseen reductase [Aquisalimonas sp.]